MSELEVTMPWLSLSNRLMEAITGEPRFFFFFFFFLLFPSTPLPGGNMSAALPHPYSSIYLYCVYHGSKSSKA